MRHVIYADQDLEPITVIELDSFCENILRRHENDHLVIAVMEPLKPFATMLPPMEAKMREVRIRAERFVRRRPGRPEQRSLMLFTEDDESALLLKSVFLPGQHREVQQRERDAFVNGLVSAIKGLR